MDAAHFHLVLNHAPLFALVFATLGLAWVVFRADGGVARASLGLLVLAGLLVVPTYLTGEDAEDIVEDQVGVSHQAIEEHEESALGAAIATGIVGLVALVVLVLFRQGEVPRTATVSMLVLTLAAAGWIGYVANLGGQINHPEIRPAPTSASPGSYEVDDD